MAIMNLANYSTKQFGLRTQTWLKGGLWLVFVFALIPQFNAQADMGPKPTMEFIFTQNFDPSLTIVEGTLLECNDAICAHPKPLEELGPQGFRCDPDRCTSMAYGYSDYHRLVIRFSDGKVRESNIFRNRYFDAVYQVTVQADDLIVEEDLWRSNSAFAGIFSFIFWLCGMPTMLIAALLSLTWIAKRTEEVPLAFSKNRGPYLLAWIVSGIMLLVGSLVSPTLPLTILIETILGGMYAKIRQRSTIMILTLVILVNSITQPFLVFAYSIVDTNGVVQALVYLLILEILIWIGEAVMLYLPLRKQISIKETLSLSFILNMTSFLVGFLIRV
jgi:hypothetical protein